jgi:hypothetical protein
MDGQGHPRPVVERVAARARMPHPGAMRFPWPTEIRRYTQFYGERQQHYYDTSAYHSLRGGHNGADMQVEGSAPADSPIYACLSGTATDKRMIETGYGHHARIASEVAGVGRVTMLYGHMTHVTIEEGQAVQAGQQIGTAGSTGASSGPHLHLSMNIEGFALPANANHLNPRPYLDPLPPPRGRPREPYSRTYVLLPPQAGTAWAQAVVEASWDLHRFTVGGSADDAGIGDLDHRRVVAVNPAEWQQDLLAFFAEHYPGVACLGVHAENPEALRQALETLPEPEASPSGPERGKPREPYARTYVLLPPGAGEEWASAAVAGGWGVNRFTIGGSADDAGVGDLDYRRVVAVNPAAWGDDLLAFFDEHYPGVLYVPIEAVTPENLQEELAAL